MVNAEGALPIIQFYRASSRERADRRGDGRTVENKVNERARYRSGRCEVQQRPHLWTVSYKSLKRLAPRCGWYRLYLNTRAELPIPPTLNREEEEGAVAAAY